MFSVFDESGIFIAACRHRFVLLACDMVRSEHFAFWDEDKYAALTLTLIHTLTIELSAVKQALNLTDADFIRFHADEKSYLESLKEPPLQDRLQIRYVQVLDDLAEWQLEWVRAREVANQALTDVAIGDLHQINTAITQVQIQVDAAYAKLQNAEAFTSHIENQLAIEERWTVGGEKYIKFKEEASLQKYHVALNELERLVVMRLFELSKLSLSGTGYKLRQQIGKALQRRSDAIRNAINKYNLQAAALDPPWPRLLWKDIADYSFLGEFDLLRYSRTDIREVDWSKPAYREASVFEASDNGLALWQRMSLV
ncbi:hypothetical protein EV702DRAFT_1181517 [Suillus placidus]|uniref:Uncharacterized protein n=1 Tax=Suillus placidus TaxID=48579 RepID=A0A9P6ZLB1_9AGAM|nr:hypothetical protein EV702DRAFT_1181517 [Suillus placidus]